jgi:hypothetical protein
LTGTAKLLVTGLAIVVGACSNERRAASSEHATDTALTVQVAASATPAGDLTTEQTKGAECAPSRTIVAERVRGASTNSVISERSFRAPRLQLLKVVDSPDKRIRDIEDLSVTLYRIQVATESRTDTIPGVQTTTLPTVGADGNIYAFGYDEGGIMLGAYRYDPETRKLAELQVPPGARMLETHMAISPDTRHIAYISTESCASGMVRSWPDGKLIAQTPAEPWFRSDIDYNDVRWLDTNRAEIVYRSGRVIETRPDGSRGSRGLWVHAIIAVDTPGVKLDSLLSKPDWKR